MAALCADTEMVNRVQYSLSRTAQNKSFPHDTKSKMYQIYIPLHFIKCGWNQEQPTLRLDEKKRVCIRTAIFWIDQAKCDRIQY